MGIRGLNKAIKQYASKSFKEKFLKNYRGSRIAIDSEILIYKYRSQAYKQTDYNPEDFHLHAFTNNVINYLDNGIIPIYVFDGRPPVAKQENILVKRYEEKSKVKNQISELEDKFVEKCNIKSKDSSTNVEYNSYLADDDTLELLDLLLKTQNKCTIVSKIHRQECKYLLKLLGVPIISADGEAEALCVKLAANGLADYVFTEDSDAITYAIAGNDVLKKDIKVLKKGSSYSKIIETSTKKVLQDFKFTQDQFLDFCILSGSDYTPTIPRIGPITSYKLIKEHKTIENCLGPIAIKHKIPDNFDFKEARSIFKNPPVTLPDDVTEYVINDPDIENLKKFLIDEKSMNPGPMIFKYMKSYQKHDMKLRKSESQSFLNISAESFRFEEESSENPKEESLKDRVTETTEVPKSSETGAIIGNNTLDRAPPGFEKEESSSRNIIPSILETKVS
jgi:flap endonuclease-1